MVEITQDQFTANLEQMPEEAQVQVVQLIEQNEPPVLQAFATSLGVTLSMGEEPMAEEPMPQEQPSVLDEVMAEEPVAPEEPAPVEAPLPEASPMQDQMQQLALGDQVAGMIDQPGAEDQTGVADDVPMNAREGAFIVNAAAIAKVGKKDFEERIIEPAIEYLEKKEGIEVDKATITRPAQQVKGKQKILASNKEYHIPKELAEVIGTDLLEKINKRGEAETEKKLEEQKQQPQKQQQQQQDFSQKQVPVRAANGGKVGNPKKKVDPREEAKRKLRIRENDFLEKNTDKLFTTKAEYRTKANNKLENFRTLGFGHKVVPKKSASLFQTLFNVSPQDASRIANGKLGITRDQALKLFDKDYDTKEKDVIRRVGGGTIYAGLPVEIQGVFVDANFRGDFIKTDKKGSIVKQEWVKHALNGDYAAASTEVLNHKELKANPKSGVAKRLRDYSKTLASFAVNSPPEGRTPLALEEAPPAQQTQNSFMSEERQQGLQPIPASELPTEENIRRRNQGANTITYFTKDAATR